jgi:hypothetical protein
LQRWIRHCRSNDGPVVHDKKGYRLATTNSRLSLPVRNMLFSLRPVNGLYSQCGALCRNAARVQPIVTRMGEDRFLAGFVPKA